MLVVTAYWLKCTWIVLTGNHMFYQAFWAQVYVLSSIYKVLQWDSSIAYPTIVAQYCRFPWYTQTCLFEIMQSEMELVPRPGGESPFISFLCRSRALVTTRPAALCGACVATGFANCRICKSDTPQLGMSISSTNLCPNLLPCCIRDAHEKVFKTVIFSVLLSLVPFTWNCDFCQNETLTCVTV